MSVMLNFAMFPTDKGESVGPYVSRSLEVVDGSGVDYRFGPMGTAIEADDWDQALDVVKQCFEKMQGDCARIYCTISIDYRRGPTGRLTSKIESVERRVDRKLKK